MGYDMGDLVLKDPTEQRGNSAEAGGRLHPRAAVCWGRGRPGGRPGHHQRMGAAGTGRTQAPGGLGQLSTYVGLWQVRAAGALVVHNLQEMLNGYLSRMQQRARRTGGPGATGGSLARPRPTAPRFRPCDWRMTMRPDQLQRLNDLSERLADSFLVEADLASGRATAATSRTDAAAARRPLLVQEERHGHRWRAAFHARPHRPQRGASGRRPRRGRRRSGQAHQQAERRASAAVDQALRACQGSGLWRPGQRKAPRVGFPVLRHLGRGTAMGGARRALARMPLAGASRRPGGAALLPRVRGNPRCWPSTTHGATTATPPTASCTRATRTRPRTRPAVTRARSCSATLTRDAEALRRCAASSRSGG